MLRTIAVGPLLAVVLLASCASVDEFRALEREVVELKRRQSQPSNQQQRIAELGAQLGDLRAEVDRLRGLVEELEFTLQRLNEGGSAPIGENLPPGDPTSPGGAPAFSGPVDPALAPPTPADPQLGVDPGEVGSVSSPTPPGTTPAPGPAGPVRGIGAEVASYEEAFRLYRADSYDLAIAGFRDFLQRYPESDYADNALFWLGESYFKQGDHASAAVAFEDVARKYPDGNKVPDALYRQGIALLELGRASGEPAKFRGAAREIFAKLLERYPDSARAEEARRQLEKLGT